jgi:chaperonin GroL
MDKYTSVVFDDEARKQLFEGMKIVGLAVASTLGPRGKTVIIQQQDKSPIVTKDGVTVSKSIRLSNPLQAMGADLIKEAASRTNDVAGDGTTTATVLTYSLIREGIKLLTSGHDAMMLTSGMTKAVECITDELRRHSRTVSTREEIAQIASISANNDQTIGELLARAIDHVGKRGIVTVEDAKGMNTTLSVIEGTQFDRGYLSPYFVNNNERMHAAYDDAKILIVDKKISDLREMLPLLEKIVSSRVRGLLIIAEDVEGDLLQGLILNKIKANLPVVAVRAPEFGTKRDELLEDLCALTGATLVSSKAGVKLSDVGLDQLGSCKKFITDVRSTIIVGSDVGSTLSDHVSNLAARLEDVTLAPEEIAWLQERIARLTNGAAIIKVGGATETEMIERKYRIEDALHATRAAAEEGIVLGGGTALLNAAKQINVNAFEPSDRVGVELVIRACEEPLRKIVENAGSSPDVVINDLLRTEETIGYDAANAKIVDLFKAGIIDPLKVSRTALMNAVSIATTFLNLGAAIYEERVDHGST